MSSDAVFNYILLYITNASENFSYSQKCTLGYHLRKFGEVYVLTPKNLISVFGAPYHVVCWLSKAVAKRFSSQKLLQTALYV